MTVIGMAIGSLLLFSFMLYVMRYYFLIRKKAKKESDNVKASEALLIIIIISIATIPIGFIASLGIISLTTRAIGIFR